MTDLKINDRVQFTSRNNKTSTNVGTICRMIDLYKNRGMPKWGTELRHFVKLDDPNIYPTLLSRGWLIVGNNDRLYTIEEFVGDQCTIIEYNDKATPFPTCRTVNLDFIVGMSVYLPGFNIVKM